MQTIKIEISKSGKIDIGVHGAKGGTCEEIIRKIARNLGEIEQVRYKDEYYENEISAIAETEVRT